LSCGGETSSTAAEFFRNADAFTFAFVSAAGPQRERPMSTQGRTNQ
jgi:hypothetical protein